MPLRGISRFRPSLGSLGEECQGLDQALERNVKFRSALERNVKV